MADVIKRLKYYNGQFLQQQDFTAEQEYHLDRQRRHNRQLHTPGIADGLAVTIGTTSVSVAPGTAIDGEGRQIVLHEPRTVGFAGALNGQSALVVISYTQEEADDATVGDAGKTRWKEVPLVEAIPESGAPPPSDRIPLARLQISSTGMVAQQDLTVRIPSGARLRPEEALERLRLSRQGVSPSQWPVLSSGAPGQADLAGNLNVTGNILVSGTVDGRDVSADGALNDTHRGRTDNPHNVTAAQIGALASIAGVASPGGNVTLTGASGISIAGNAAAKTITFTGGAPTSIAGVANAGGNIGLASGGAITIAPDNGSNKRITISETHSALAGNPHGTLAAQLADYDFKQIYTNSIFFLEIYGDGATLTFNTGFQPRFVWVYGYANAFMYDGWYGGSTHGFAKIDGGTITQRASGPSVIRQSSTIGVRHTGIQHGNAACVGSFYDYLSNPNVFATVSARVSATTATSITFLFNRPAAVPIFFDLWFHFICVGY